MWKRPVLIFVPGLRGEGEDVGARAAQDQGSLRQPFEGESTEVLEDGTGSYKSNVPGIFRGFSKNIRVQISLGEKGEETKRENGYAPENGTPADLSDSSAISEISGHFDLIWAFA